MMAAPDIRPKSYLDWLGILGAFLAAIIMAVKAADLKLVTGAPMWLASHVWNFVPLSLMTFYGSVVVYRFFHPLARQERDAFPEPPAAGNRLMSIAPSAPVAISQPPAANVADPGITSEPNEEPERIFVSSTTTPESIACIRRGRTSVQARHAIMPFIGKWLRYKGAVSNVRVYSSSFTITFWLGDGGMLSFTVEGHSELAHLISVDDTIEIVGRIADVDGGILQLDKAEIIER